MSSVVAHEKKIRVSNDNSTWHDLPATSGSLNQGATVLDDTDLDNEDYRTRLLGLKDWSISVSVNYKTQSLAIDCIKDFLYTDANLFVRYLPNGTYGLGGACVVESRSTSGGVDELTSGDISLQGNGLLSEI